MNNYECFVRCGGGFFRICDANVANVLLGEQLVVRCSVTDYLAYVRF